MCNRLMNYFSTQKRNVFTKEKSARFSTQKRNVFTKEKLAYEECQTFMPLHDGDVVFCPSVYDGDSFRLCWIDYAGRKSKIMGRLSGVDTPELRGSSEKEKALALAAKKRLEEAIAGQFVTIRNPGVEKYGRSMSDLQVKHVESVADHMLAAPDLCKSYAGGKKQKWD